MTSDDERPWGSGSRQITAPTPAPRPPLNSLAIISLVLGILWLCGLGSIAALVTGVIALRQIATSGSVERGRGLAIAGAVLGGIGTAIVAAILVGAAILALIADNEGSSDDILTVDTSTSAVAATDATREMPPLPTTTSTLQGDAIVGSTPCPPRTGSARRVAQFSAPPPTCIDPNVTYSAMFTTTAGTIRVHLDTRRTPNTVNNFVVLARYQYYNGTAFFRTDPSIGIVQGGGLKNTDKPGYLIQDEGGRFTYSPGDLVMARSGQPNSGGGQFFFGVNENVSRLDAQGTYVTFGRVTKGLDALEKVLASHRDEPGNPAGGTPWPPVVVHSVRIDES